MFRPSSVHHQERFVQAVFADQGLQIQLDVWTDEGRNM